VQQGCISSPPLRTPERPVLRTHPRGQSTPAAATPTWACPSCWGWSAGWTPLQKPQRRQCVEWVKQIGFRVGAIRMWPAPITPVCVFPRVLGEVPAYSTLQSQLTAVMYITKSEPTGSTLAAQSVRTHAPGANSDAPCRCAHAAPLQRPDSDPDCSPVTHAARLPRRINTPCLPLVVCCSFPACGIEPQGPPQPHHMCSHEARRKGPTGPAAGAGGEGAKAGGPPGVGGGGGRLLRSCLGGFCTGGA
jgi:hypothetical protein